MGFTNYAIKSKYGKEINNIENETKKSETIPLDQILNSSNNLESKEEKNIIEIEFTESPKIGNITGANGLNIKPDKLGEIIVKYENSFGIDKAIA